MPFKKLFGRSKQPAEPSNEPPVAHQAGGLYDLPAASEGTHQPQEVQGAAISQTHSDSGGLYDSYSNQQQQRPDADTSAFSFMGSSQVGQEEVSHVHDATSNTSAFDFVVDDASQIQDDSLVPPDASSNSAFAFMDSPSDPPAGPESSSIYATTSAQLQEDSSFEFMGNASGQDSVTSTAPKTEPIVVRKGPVKRKKSLARRPGYGSGASDAGKQAPNQASNAAESTVAMPIVTQAPAPVIPPSIPELNTDEQQQVSNESNRSIAEEKRASKAEGTADELPDPGAPNDPSTLVGSESAGEEDLDLDLGGLTIYSEGANTTAGIQPDSDKLPAVSDTAIPLHGSPLPDQVHAQQNEEHSPVVAGVLDTSSTSANLGVTPSEPSPHHPAHHHAVGKASTSNSCLQKIGVLWSRSEKVLLGLEEQIKSAVGSQQLQEQLGALNSSWTQLWGEYCDLLSDLDQLLEGIRKRQIELHSVKEKIQADLVASEQELEAATENDDFANAEQISYRQNELQLRDSQVSNELKRVNSEEIDVSSQFSTLLGYSVDVADMFSKTCVIVQELSSEHASRMEAEGTQDTKEAESELRQAKQSVVEQQDVLSMETNLCTEEENSMDEAMAQHAGPQMAKKKELLQSRSALQKELDELLKLVDAKTTEIQNVDSDIENLDLEMSEIRNQFGSQLRRLEKRRQAVISAQNEMDACTVVVSEKESQLDHVKQTWNSRLAHVHTAVSDIKGSANSFLNSVKRSSDSVRKRQTVMSSVSKLLAEETVAQDALNSAEQLYRDCLSSQQSIADGLMKLRAQAAQGTAATSDLLQKIPQLQAMKKEAATARKFKEAQAFATELKECEASRERLEKQMEEIKERISVEEHALQECEANLCELKTQQKSAAIALGNVSFQLLHGKASMVHLRLNSAIAVENFELASDLDQLFQSMKSTLASDATKLGLEAPTFEDSPEIKQDSPPSHGLQGADHSQSAGVCVVNTDSDGTVSKSIDSCEEHDTSGSEKTSQNDEEGDDDILGNSQVARMEGTHASLEELQEENDVLVNKIDELNDKIDAAVDEDNFEEAGVLHEQLVAAKARMEELSVLLAQFPTLPDEADAESSTSSSRPTRSVRMADEGDLDLISDSIVPTRPLIAQEVEDVAGVVMGSSASQAGSEPSIGADNGSAVASAFSFLSGASTGYDEDDRGSKDGGATVATIGSLYSHYSQPFSEAGASGSVLAARSVGDVDSVAADTDADQESDTQSQPSQRPASVPIPVTSSDNPFPSHTSVSSDVAGQSIVENENVEFAELEKSRSPPTLLTSACSPQETHREREASDAVPAGPTSPTPESGTCQQGPQEDGAEEPEDKQESSSLATPSITEQSSFAFMSNESNDGDFDDDPSREAAKEDASEDAPAHSEQESSAFNFI